MLTEKQIFVATDGAEARSEKVSQNPFITHAIVDPEILRAGGKGLALSYGFHDSPFGRALVMAAGPDLAGLGFAEPDGDADALADMTRRWPNAAFLEDTFATAPLAARAFDRTTWRAGRPLALLLIGTPFQLLVWEALLATPFGRTTTYSDLAARIGRPEAVRAVGAAVGRNPISFVVPCHRALGRSGALTGYHWGLARKRAMLDWEARHRG